MYHLIVPDCYSCQEKIILKTRSTAVMCEHCGATLPTNHGENFTTCRYCGSKHAVSDDVQIAHIEAKLQLDLAEKQRQAEEDKRKFEIEKIKAENDRFRKSKINWLWLVFGIISATCIEINSEHHKPIPIAIASIQTLLYISSWVIGKYRFTSKIQVVRSILIPIALVLIIPFLLNI